MITRLLLRSFRNIDTLELQPEGGVNILWGDNAQGKTNLLEAIYLLAALKSFRSAGNEDFIAHGEEGCRLAAEIDRLQVRRRLSLTISRQGKKVRLDDKEITRPAEYFGCLQAVLFAPEEINLVKGSPAGRRALLDRAIFQTDVDYLMKAKEFDRHLRQRNRLLREGRGDAELAPWTEGFVRSGALLRQRRFLYIERLRPRFRQTYRRLVGGVEEADISYPTGAAEVNELMTNLAAEVARVSERERCQGQSLAGPHRDDIEFSLAGRSLRLFGSQGQQRSFVLAFKTAQVEDLHEVAGEPPVLLLDDMTSELDNNRQNSFFRYLTEGSGQVFITTTDVAPLRKQGFSRARFFRIRNGGLFDDSQG